MRQKWIALFSSRFILGLIQRSEVEKKSLFRTVRKYVSSFFLA